MKILIATAVYYPVTNGVAVFSHNLAVGLAKRGHEVVVLAPSKNGKNYTEMQDGVKVVFLKSVRVWVYPDQINPVPAKKKLLGKELPHVIYKNGFRVSVFPKKQINKVMQEFCPDVVHVQDSDMIGLSVVNYAKKHQIPVVTTEHNQPEVIIDQFKALKPIKKPMSAALLKYLRSYHEKSDFVTMPTVKSIHHFLAGREFEVPIAAVSNGVDLSNFRPGKAPEEIYEKYQIPADCKIVLYVGRVDPEKKVGVVLEAFSEVYEKYPEAFLLVVGDGIDKARLEKKVKSLKLGKSAKFLGKVMPPDLYEIYKTGSVFVTASEIETQGIVLIEAAATGLPLVAVNKGAVSEICQDDKNGYLCRSEDAEGISRAVLKIITDDKKQAEFSENSIKIASEHDFEKTLDQFINIYNKVIKDKK